MQNKTKQFFVNFVKNQNGDSMSQIDANYRILSCDQGKK